MEFAVFENISGYNLHLKIINTKPTDGGQY